MDEGNLIVWKEKWNSYDFLSVSAEISQANIDNNFQTYDEHGILQETGQLDKSSLT